MPANSPAPMDRLREQWGFVPNLFQSHPLPERLEIAVRLIDAILFQDSKLPRLRKELLLLTLAAATGNSYWAGIHFQILLLMGMPEDTAIAAVRDFRSAPLDNEVRVLIRFAIEAAVLGQYEAREAHAAGLADDALQDTVALAGLSIYLNALTAPAKPEPDFGPWTQPVVPVTELFAPEGSPDSIEPVIERMFAGRPDLRGHLWRPEISRLSASRWPTLIFRIHRPPNPVNLRGSPIRTQRSSPRHGKATRELSRNWFTNMDGVFIGLLPEFSAIMKTRKTRCRTLF